PTRRSSDLHAHGTVFGSAGNGHQSAQALGDLVDATALAVRACLPETADAAVDQARIDLLDVVPADLEAVLDRCAHVFHENIGTLDEALENCVALLGLEVELHHALVAVEILEVGRMTAANDILSTRFRRLGSDDVGPPIRQVPHARRTGARQRQIENYHSSQRQPRRAIAPCNHALILCKFTQTQ